MCLILGAINLTLLVMARRFPRSILNRQAETAGGDLLPMHVYLISVVGQAVLLPALCLLSLLQRQGSMWDWWFGSTTHGGSSTIFMAYVQGYFVQDCVTHWHILSVGQLIHHV